MKGSSKDKRLTQEALAARRALRARVRASRRRNGVVKGGQPKRDSHGSSPKGRRWRREGEQLVQRQWEDSRGEVDTEQPME